MVDMTKEGNLFHLPVISVIHIVLLVAYSLICLMIIILLQGATTQGFSLYSNIPVNVLAKYSLSQLKNANISFSCLVIKGDSSDWYTIYLLQIIALWSFVVLAVLVSLGIEFKRKIRLTFSPKLIKKLNRLKHQSREKIVEFILDNLENLMKIEGHNLVLLSFIIYWLPPDSLDINFNFHNEDYSKYFFELCQSANANRTINNQTLYIYEKRFDGIRSYFIYLIVNRYLRIVVLIAGIIAFVNLIQYINCYYDTISSKIGSTFLVLKKNVNEKIKKKQPVPDDSSDGDIYLEAED